MTARDKVLTALQRGGYTRQGATDLLATFEMEVRGEAAPFDVHADEALRVAALDGAS